MVSDVRCHRLGHEVGGLFEFVLDIAHRRPSKPRSKWLEILPINVTTDAAVFDLGLDGESIVAVDVRSDSSPTAVEIAPTSPDCLEQIQLTRLDSPRIEPGACAWPPCAGTYSPRAAFMQPLS
jgi:hypothetical protein